MYFCALKSFQEKINLFLGKVDDLMTEVIIFVYTYIFFSYQINKCEGFSWVCFPIYIVHICKYVYVSIVACNTQ